MPIKKLKEGQSIEQLCDIFAQIHDKNEAKIFLNDLFTPKELVRIGERLKIVLMLSQGLPQRTIKKNLKVSIALVTRASRALKKSHGGFELVLKAIHNSQWWNTPSTLGR